MQQVVWRYAISDGVPSRSAIAALIVGTILNLINQGDALTLGAPLNWAKIVLTYIVPYCVATYGAVSSYRMSVSRPENETSARHPSL